MANEGKTSNLERLETLLKFNPSKRPTATQTLLAKVQKDLMDAREKQAEEEARKVLVEAIAIHEQATKCEQQFRQQHGKLDKELGKLMNILDSMNRGLPAPQEDEGAAPEGAPAPA